MKLSKHAVQAIKFILISNFIFIVCVLGLELNDAKNQIQAEVDKYNALNVEYNEKYNALNDELAAAGKTIADLKSDEYEIVYIGEYKLTHYCNEEYAHICGYGKRITATGTTTTVGRSAAVDPKVIPYGTQMYIEGYGWRIAEDCGGSVKNNHIDVLVDYHNEALAMGVKTGGIWVLAHKNPLTTQN